MSEVLEISRPVAAAAVTPASPRGETRRRSLLKAVSWRALGTVGTMAAAWFLTGEWKLTLAIGSIEAASKVALFYVHERLWARFG